MNVEESVNVVILAGGLGTRLAEETEILPKPMVEIGGRPILWHIMKIYACFGFSEFVVLTGYKSHVIKEYFLRYYTRYSDITVDLAANSVEIHKTSTEPWKVSLLYTGPNTMTGGRLLRAKHFLGEAPFMLTYGDGVSNVDISKLLACHKKAGKIATVTSVKPSGRFGSLDIDKDGAVKAFREKKDTDRSWISGGFFVMQPEIFDYLADGDETSLEGAPLERLAEENQLNAYKHNGFWRPMDTLRDKLDLTSLWMSGKAPWALWLNKNA